MEPQEILQVASDGLQARLTGQWVHDKKYYLERYLDTVTRGVGAKWNGCLSYIDLFSGPGKSIVRGTEEEVDGSPLIALKYDFSGFVFIDTPEVISVLKKRLAAHAKLARIHFIEGDCNDVIQRAVARLPPDHLTLAFIDPTGLQIQFKTISRLVQNRKVDLLMTIQFGMGIRMIYRSISKVRELHSRDFWGTLNGAPIRSRAAPFLKWRCAS